MGVFPSFIRVLIVDDHALLRDTLRERLEDEADLQVVGTCSNGREALELLQQVPVDVVLMDVDMPELDGIAATQAIKQDHPGTRVVALTAYDQDETLLGMMTAGSDGFCLKTIDVSTLIQAIHWVAQGATYLPPEINLRLRQLMQRSWQGMGSPPEQAVISLTAREQEILQGIAQGLSNSEMAELHAISVNTVRCHVKNILTKLDVHDRLQAVRKAKHMGWLK